MIRIELSLRLANSPGALAGVCRLLSNERVNIQAMAHRDRRPAAAGRGQPRPRGGGAARSSSSGDRAQRDRHGGAERAGRARAGAEVDQRRRRQRRIRLRRRLRGQPDGDDRARRRRRGTRRRRPQASDEALRRARWTRSSSTSTPTAACGSRTKTGRSRRCRSGAPSSTRRRRSSSRSENCSRSSRRLGDLARPGDSSDRRAGRIASAATTARFLALTLALFVALTAVMTWPQVLRMSDGVHDPGDPLMVTWVLGWVAHQLPRAPAHIFDANIFYPERNTLAYSETLLVPGLFAAPLHWLGVAPILIYNLVFLSGFALSGRRRRAAGAPADRQRRRRDRRRHRLRVSAVPHRSLRAPAAAADAVHPARAVGVPSSARQRPPARRRAARRVRRVSDAVVHLLRHLPDSVHGGRLRDDADRDGRRCRGERIVALRRGGGDRHGGDDAGRARLSGGAQGGGRARTRRDRAEQRDVAQLPGAAGGERRLREGVRALHGSGATAVSGFRRGRARDRRALAANTARTARLCCARRSVPTRWG